MSSYRRTSRNTVVAAVGASLLFTLTPGAAAAADEIGAEGMPSAEDVKFAKNAVAQQGSEVAHLDAQLRSYSQDLRAVEHDALLASEDYNGAVVRLEEAELKAERLSDEAAAAREEADAASVGVGRYAAATYKRGGGFGTLAALLSEEGPAGVLDRAAGLSMVGKIRNRDFKQAAAATTLADALERQAAKAEAQRTAAALEAEQAKAGADEKVALIASEGRRIADAKEATIDELAELREVSVETEQERQAGLEEQARLKREEENRRRIQEKLRQEQAAQEQAAQEAAEREAAEEAAAQEQAAQEAAEAAAPQEVAEAAAAQEEAAAQEAAEETAEQGAAEQEAAEQEAAEETAEQGAAEQEGAEETAVQGAAEEGAAGEAAEEEAAEEAAAQEAAAKERAAQEAAGEAGAQEEAADEVAAQEAAEQEAAEEAAEQEAAEEAAAQEAAAEERAAREAAEERAAREAAEEKAAEEEAAGKAAEQEAAEERAAREAAEEEAARQAAEERAAREAAEQEAARQAAEERAAREAAEKRAQKAAGAGIAVSFAMSQVGDPYEWAAAGPHTWDCSGLTQVAYQQAGVQLVHHSATQYRQVEHVPFSQAKPGDLLFFSRNGAPSGIYHVAIYLGNEKMVHATRSYRPDDAVKVTSIYYMSDMLWTVGRPA